MSWDLGCVPRAACPGAWRNGARLRSIQERTLSRPQNTQEPLDKCDRCYNYCYCCFSPHLSGPKLYASLGSPRSYCTRKTYHLQ